MNETRKLRHRRSFRSVLLLTFLACCGLPGGAEAQTSDTFGVGERIPTFPRGSAALSGSFSNANVQLSGGIATVTIRAGGYARYSDYTYTCDVSECTIVDQEVTRGVVRRESSTPVPTLPLAGLLLLTLMLFGGSWLHRRRRALSFEAGQVCRAGG